MDELITYVGLDVHKETIAVAIADEGKRGEVREHGLDQMAQKVTGDAPGCLLVQFGKGELRGPVDGDEEVELSLPGADLGDINVEVA